MKSKLIHLFLLLATLQVQVQAATRYVKNVASGTGSGNSWANASSDLQLMIDQSNANDEVWVASGFYKPTRLHSNTALISLNDRNNSFVMKPNVKIYGGFFGNETTIAARVWQSHQTVLDGDIGTVNDSSDNVYSVVRCTTAVGTATLDGFHIRNGNGSGLTPASGAQSGSGLYIFSGSPAVANCYFYDNISIDGGAIYIQSGAPVIYNCQFSRNTALGEGGAINGYIPGAYIVDRCYFSANKALNGGAIANQYSQLSQTLQIKNSIFQGNYASGTGFSGGGAVYNYDNVVAEYTNCTFAGNRAVSYGGAIFTLSGGGGDVLKNCILWDNAAVTSGMNLLDTFGAVATATYSIIEGGFTGTGNSAANPAFAQPRPASWAPTVSGDYKLLPCSPAINGGNNTYLTVTDNLDYYGNTRIDNTTVDIGAFETTHQPISPDPNGRVYVNKNIFIQGSGGAWGIAQRELADALRAAQADTSIHEIWVAAGTYLPMYDLVSGCSGADLRNRTFLVPDNVRIYGGFAGTETSLSQRNPAANHTILDGDLGVYTDTSDNAYHVLVLPYNAVGTLLDGLTIKNGIATGSGFSIVSGLTIPQSAGGGIFKGHYSNTTLNNVIFENNIAKDYGALSFLYGGSISNCIFRNNTAFSHGGAIFTTGTTDISNTTFSGNTAWTSIYEQSGGSSRLVNCLFTGNYSTLNINYNFTTTPGMVNTFGAGATTTLVNCVFSGNYRNNASTALVKVISNQLGSNTILRNSIVWGNTDQTAPIGGGNTGSFTISHSIVQGSAGSDPQFLNAPSAATAPFTVGDYRVAKCSPAINTGDNTYLNITDTLDARKNKRISEVRVDMGAYEYTAARPGAAGIVYVDSSKTTSGEGDNWNNALKELADALRAAKYDTAIHEIWVAKGTYKPLYSADSMLCNPANNRAKSFVMAQDLKLYGGFAGNETSLTQRNLAANKTTLSGDIGTPGTATDNSYHVVIASRLFGSTATLDGFTITGGYNSFTGGIDTLVVNDNKVYNYMGGGISTSHAALTIRNCILSGNQAYYGGGAALYGHGTYLFNGNYYQDAAATTSFTNCVLSGNVSNNTIYPGGGALYRFNSWAAMDIINTTITGNRADFKGGAFAQAVPHSGSITNIRNSILWQNDGIVGDDQLDTAANATISIANSIVDGGYRYGINVMELHPLFLSGVNAVNAPTTAGDFRLARCSPAINAGDNSLLAGATTDINGGIRVQQNTIDMGAFENTAPTLSITPGDSVASTNYNYACGQTSPDFQPKYTWTNIYGANFSHLILALQDTHQVLIGSFPINVHSKISSNYGTGTIQQISNPFGQTGYYYPINRTWSVSTATPITAPVNLRFYISPNDSMQLAAATSFGNLQNLILYKVNGSDPYAAAATGYKEYTYAATADTSHFTIGTHQGLRYVEFWVTGFSSGTLAFKSAAPLSISLGEFAAVNVGKKNRIDWNTLHETATDKITLERSGDGKEFTPIAVIPVKGKASSYTYWDEQPLNGMNYYRLQLTEANGQNSYSRTAMAFVEGDNAFALQVYPNPVSDELHIDIFGTIGQGAQLTITNLTGKTILQQAVTGKQTLLHLQQLAAGMYFIKYTDTDRQQTLKFQKR